MHAVLGLSFLSFSVNLSIFYYNFLMYMKLVMDAKYCN